MKSVLQITCSECRDHLLTFMHNGTTPLLRRQVSRHLNHCSACYALYSAELDLVRELSRGVPQIGQQPQPNFAHIWAGVEADLQKPNLTVSRFQFRYGVAMLALVLVLLMPFTLGNHNLSFSELPTPPAPAARITPNGTVSKNTDTTVAFLSDFQQSTPEPQHTIGPQLPDAVITPSF